jgi:hypothetical protein
MKGSDGRGLQTKEENMSTFSTIAGLQRLTDGELDFLCRSVTDRLAGYKQGTPERREALATLALIRRVIARRQARGPRPGF